MNLFTKYLARSRQNQPLHDLIENWDQLEILVITIFKSKENSADDEAVYAKTRAWLLKNYPRWESDLEPLWRQTLVGGKLATEDPFRRIFRGEKSAEFLTDWGAMQNLAAAREALNRLIQNDS
jgi:hypothetical protein